MADTTKPSGGCPKCGVALDDHDGWLSKASPTCPSGGRIRKVLNAHDVDLSGYAGGR